MKYKIGQTVFWVYSSTTYEKKIPCPMCFGKKYVTVILGDDSHVKSQCGFCQAGIDAPSGLAMTWEPHAAIKMGTISGVSTKDGIRYEIGYTTLSEHEVFDCEDDAKPKLAEELKSVTETADRWFKENFVNATKKQVWSAGYHRNCIEREKRSIEWHEYRLMLIKDKKAGVQKDE